MRFFPDRKKAPERPRKKNRWRTVRRNRVEGKYASPTLRFTRWLDDIAAVFFTPQGRILLISLLPAAFFALLLTRSPAFLLFLLLVLLFVLDAFCKLFFPRRLKIERRPPPRVAAGTPFEIRTRVRNDSFLPAYDFEVNRNLGPCLIRNEKRIPLYCLPPRSELLIRNTYRIRQRGVYELPPASVEGIFPFRLTKAVRRDRVWQEIICHPVYTQVRSLRLPGGRAIPDRNELNMSNRTGESLDLLGCRDYREGDDPRKIHWTASARLRRLIVKEFEEEQLSSAAVILDNYCPSRMRQGRELLRQMFTLKSLTGATDQPFEAAVSLTASIAASLAARNFVIDVFASGSEIHHFRTGRNTMSFESFLDLLSSLECSRSEDRFEQLPGSELSRAAQAGAVFLILLRVDPEAEKLYHELLRRGANLRVFTFDPRDSVPAWAESLTCAEILENRRTDL